MVEKLVCQLFFSNKDICPLRALRWRLFTKKLSKSQQLPPTQAALHQAVFRAHYQLLVWNNDIVLNPVLPSPEGFGWKWEEDKEAWIPVMTTLPPAPEAIIHLVKYAKERCANNCCKCRKAGLTCTDLFRFSDTKEDCKNKSVDVNDDGCNDEDDDDDVDDDDESEYEYISDSDGELN